MERRRRRAARLAGGSVSPPRTRRTPTTSACSTWCSTPHNDGAVRVGVASHNLFEVAWAATQADLRGARHRVEFEMLEGMAPARGRGDRRPPRRAAAVRPHRGPGRHRVRHRLPGPPPGRKQRPRQLPHPLLFPAGRARRCGRRRRTGSGVPWRTGATGWCARPAGSRTGPRTRTGPAPVRCSRNEPDTDFSIAANREWIAAAPGGPAAPAAGVPARSWPERRCQVPATEAGIDPSAPGGGAGLPLAVGRPGGGGGGGGVPPGRPDRAGPSRSRPARRAGPARARPTPWPAGEASCWPSWPSTPPRRSGRATRRSRRPSTSPPTTPPTSPPPASASGPSARWWWRSPWNFPLSIPAGGVLAALAAGQRGHLQARARVGGGRRRAGRGAVGGRGAPVGAAVRAVRRRRRQPAAHHPPGRGRRGADRVVGHGPAVPRLAARIWHCTPRPAARTPWSSPPPPTSTRPSPTWCTRRSVTPGRSARPPAWPSSRRSVHDDPRFLRRLADAVRSLRGRAGVGPGHDHGPADPPAGGPAARGLHPAGPGERWLVPPRPSRRRAATCGRRA